MNWPRQLLGKTQVVVEKPWPKLLVMILHCCRKYYCYYCRPKSNLKSIKKVLLIVVVVGVDVEVVVVVIVDELQKRRDFAYYPTHQNCQTEEMVVACVKWKTCQ